MRTNQAIRIDPNTVAVLHARARRARAVAMHNLAVRLLQKLTPRLDLRLWGTHWG